MENLETKLNNLIVFMREEAESKIEECLSNNENDSLIQYWVGRRDAVDVVALTFQEDV